MGLEWLAARCQERQGLTSLPMKLSPLTGLNRSFPVPEGRLLCRQGRKSLAAIAQTVKNKNHAAASSSSAKTSTAEF